jgi:hypothetical protein
VNLSILYTLYEWNHKIFAFCAWITSLSQFLLCCTICQNFIPFDGWILFPLYMLLFYVYLFIHSRTLGLLPCFSWITLLWTLDLFCFLRESCFVAVLECVILLPHTLNCLNYWCAPLYPVIIGFLLLNCRGSFYILVIKLSSDMTCRYFSYFVSCIFHSFDNVFPCPLLGIEPMVGIDTLLL